MEAVLQLLMEACSVAGMDIHVLSAVVLVLVEALRDSSRLAQSLEVCSVASIGVW